METKLKNYFVFEVAASCCESELSLCSYSGAYLYILCVSRCPRTAMWRWHGCCWTAARRSTCQPIPSSHPLPLQPVEDTWSWQPY